MYSQWLVEWAKKHVTEPFGFTYWPTGHVVVSLSKTGKLQSIVEVERTNAIEDASRVIPEISCTSGIVAALLADNAEYTFGIRTNPKAKRDNTAAKNAEYLKILQDCAEYLKILQDCEEPAVRTALKFLNDPQSKVAFVKEKKSVQNKRRILFRVDGKFVHDIPSVQKFWQNYVRDRQETKKMQCCVCGNVKDCVKVILDRGVGTWVGVNDENFEFRGEEQTFTSPTCTDCSRGFKAIEKLKQRKENHLYMPETFDEYMLFWAKDTEIDAAWMFGDAANPHTVEEIVRKVFYGGNPQNVDIEPDSFRILDILQVQSRLSVQSYWEEQLVNVVKNVEKWLTAQGVDHPFGVRQLTYWLTYDGNEQTQKRMYKLLIYAAFRGDSLPKSVLLDVTRAADEHIRKNGRYNEKLVAALNLARAYTGGTKVNRQELETFGRLYWQLATLQNLRRVDCGDGLRKEIRSVQLNPRRINNALNQSEHYLGKLQRHNGGAATNIRRRIAELRAGLGNDIPSTPMTPDEVAVFQTGYFAEANDNYQRWAAAAAQKKQKQQATQTIDLEA